MTEVTIAKKMTGAVEVPIADANTAVAGMMTRAPVAEHAAWATARAAVAAMKMMIMAMDSVINLHGQADVTRAAIMKIVGMMTEEDSAVHVVAINKTIHATWDQNMMINGAVAIV